MSSTLVTDLLDGLDKLAGGLHPGFRPVHAKGVMYSGTFTPSPDAAKLTRAPHAARPSTPVTVRFSLSAGIPSVADNDPMGASPQGMAVRFHLAEHVHTDIIAHSHNGFPVRTGEEFLEFLRAAAASGPGGPSPPPIVAFLAAHPAAKAFVEAPKPHPDELRPAGVLRHHRLQVHELGRPEPVRPVPPPPRSRDRVPDSRAGGEEDGRLPRRRTVGAAGQGAGGVPRAGAIGRGGG